MRLLVFGAGVIGSLYATKFSLAGFDVVVYARGKRFETLTTKGLLYNDKGTIQKATVKVIDKLNDDDIYDYIFVSVRYDQAETALLTLKQNKSKNIVTLNNTVGYNKWVAIIGNKLIPGFPAAGGDIKEEILYAKIAPKSIQKTIFAEINGEITERIKELSKVFELSKIPFVIADDILSFHITHAVFNIINKHFYTKNDIVDIQTAKSKYILSKIASDLKNNLYNLEKIGITPTPAAFGKLKKVPDFIIVFIYRFMLNLKSTRDVLLGSHAISAKNEVILLDKDFNGIISANLIK